MSERFFSPHPITAGGMMLDGPEAHHLLHVMRAAVGDEVTLFDGSGAEFDARPSKPCAAQMPSCESSNAARSTANCHSSSSSASHFPKATARNGSSKN